MVIACPACGQQNPDGFRFCGACGSPLPLDGGASAREVRKTVTIVFCDMAGSTELTDGIDPERVRALMGRYHELARSLLESHGATIEKFIGDAVTAHRGDAGAGLALLREAIAIIDRTDETMFQANARMALADTLESQGDAAGARDALREALALYRAKEIVPSVALAERRLTALA